MIIFFFLLLSIIIYCFVNVFVFSIEQIVETKYGAVEIKDESLQKLILTITANESGHLRKIILRFSSPDECRGFASKLR
jgi:hypothetical protein